MAEIRVLIADDHAFYREGVRGMLRPLSNSFALVGEASDGVEDRSTSRSPSGFRPAPCQRRR
jgi:DNA-binding NarL/FixJ family response regulator